MYILEQYRTDTLFQNELSDREFVAVQIWIVRNLFTDEMVAIKDTDLEYVALSDRFIAAFNKNQAAQSNLLFKDLDLGKLNSAEVLKQEQNIVDDLSVQHTIFISEKNKKQEYFFLRKRPLINPFTQKLVGILLVAHKLKLWTMRREYIKQIAKTVFTRKPKVQKASLSEQEKQIVFCMMLGYHSRKDISKTLSEFTGEHYSEIRIRNSLQKIYDKFECRSSAQLINLICGNQLEVDFLVESIDERSYII